MDDEVDSVGAADADLEELTGPTRPDEHDEVVELQDSDRVAVGVEDVVVVCACLRALATITGSTASTYLDVRRGATHPPRSAAPVGAVDVPMYLNLLPSSIRPELGSTVRRIRRWPLRHRL